MPIADHSYTSFLLRLWCAQQEDGYTWIACLQSTATGEQRRFADLEALVQFLQDEFGGDEGGQASQPAATTTGCSSSAGTTTVP